MKLAVLLGVIYVVGNSQSGPAINLENMLVRTVNGTVFQTPQTNRRHHYSEDR